MDKNYTSEFTKFLNAMKAADPTMEARQRAGRALLWDKPYDANRREEEKEARVPQQSYVYQTDPTFTKKVI